MNAPNETEEKQATVYIVSSKDGSKLRLIEAKSISAVKSFLVAEQWSDPRPVRVADMKSAVNAGAKIEVLR